METLAPELERVAETGSTALSAERPAAPLSSRRDEQSLGRRVLLLALLLALVTVAVYSHVLRNDFVNYDDPEYVTNNAHVLQGLTWHGLAWAMTATDAANWHPLTWISHMADVQIFGLRAGGHHLTNLLLHAINVVLLFLLLNAATRFVYRSAIVAALFGLCPLNVESVAWIAQRKSLLSTMFLLLALLAYGWYARKPGAGRYLMVAFWFLLGLLAKPMVLTLPLLLLLADYWPLERLPVPSGDVPADHLSGVHGEWFRCFGKLVAEKIPLLALSAASAFVTIYAQGRGGAVGSMANLSLRVRIDNAIYSYLAYVVKAVWPARLAVFYPHPENSLAHWKILAGALFLVGASAFAWMGRQRRYLVAGWLWYLVALVPVIGVVQVGLQAMADRYVYVPFIGLFALIVWLVADFAERARVPVAALAAIALLVLSSYAYVSYNQLGYWRNSFTLFSHAVEVTSHNAVAEDNLGATLVAMGRSDLGLPHIESAIRFMPRLSTAHYNYAVLLQTQGRLAQAAAEYRTALQTVSDPDEAARDHNNLGTALARLGQPAVAIAEYTAALKINPDEQNSYIGRGILEFGENNLSAANDDFSAATRIAPSPLPHFWLGRTMEARSDLAGAKAEYSAALRIDPAMHAAAQRLAALANLESPGVTARANNGGGGAK
jgi:protein O-mannosyl-transferase